MSTCSRYISILPASILGKVEDVVDQLQKVAPGAGDLVKIGQINVVSVVAAVSCSILGISR